MRIPFLIIPGFLAVACVTRAQDNLNMDSLIALLPAAKNDSAAAELYFRIGEQYQAHKPALAKHYYNRARDLSRKINYTAGEIGYIQHYTYVLNREGKYDSSLALNLSGVELARARNDNRLLATAMFNTATSYRYKGDNGQAIPLFIKAKELADKSPEPALAARSLDMLQVAYTDMKQYGKAAAAGDEAVTRCRMIGNVPLLTGALVNFGVVHMRQGKTAQALPLFQEAAAMARGANLTQLEASALLHIAECHRVDCAYDKLKPTYADALRLSRASADSQLEAMALEGLCFYHTYMKEFSLAHRYGAEAVAVFGKTGLPMQQMGALEAMSRLHYAMLDMNGGEDFSRQAIRIRDSLLDQQVIRDAVSMESNFALQQKESEAGRLEAEESLLQMVVLRKKLVSTVIALGLIALALIAFLAWYLYRQRKNLREQMTLESDTARQLEATEALWKAEEEERTRLAKQLHEGLGAVQAGIRQSMHAAREAQQHDEKALKDLERNIAKMDHSVQELHQAVHAFMPEALARFGLDAALRAYCNEVNHSGAMNIACQARGLDAGSISPVMCSGIYRIVVELINNISQHADARNVIVQVHKSEGKLDVVVHDDGKGFDPGTLSQNRGFGWSGILNLVDVLKGSVDVQSEAGNGTTVHATFIA
jgi:two-component system, NarL family, sensor kinase